MDKVSVIIPSWNEGNLERTLDDIYAKFTGNFEVIVVEDGPPYTKLPERHNLRTIYGKHNGLRQSINHAANLATGKYLLKVDAHCLFKEGIDETLKEECDKDWLVVPRCYPIERTDWKPHTIEWVDYYYLSCPWTHPKFFQMQSCFWLTKTQELLNIPIDDIMTFQGSLWFMHTDYWHKHLEGLFERGVGKYAEHQEIGFKVWLGGGRVIVNKNTWYAHDHRTNLQRGYFRSIADFHYSHVDVARYWTSNKWEKQVHPFSWLIEKFWPLPTKETIINKREYYWPEDWRQFFR